MGEACFNIDPATDRGLYSQGVLAATAWYAVQTGYRCEQRVALGLTNKGFETYLPLIREVHQWNDRHKVIAIPAFSGYLFVHYEPTLRKRVQVLETSGVVRLLGGNHAPNRVSDREIEAVRRAINSGVDCDHCDALVLDSLIPGALVRVMRGPLAGVEGRLVRIKNHVRLVIAISVFAQGISAEVDQGDVEAVDLGIGIGQQEEFRETDLSLRR